MRLTHFCIERPVFACVLSLVLIVIGVMSFERLQLRFNPETFEPHLRISVQYTGASAALIEQTVVEPLENALSQTPNLKVMRSQSYPQWANVNLSFKSISKEDFLQAQSQVLQAVSHVRLPDGASKPTIRTRNDTWPIIFVAVSDKNKNEIALSDYVSNTIVKPLEHIPGVASVSVNELTPALRITLRPIQMAKYGISIKMLKQVLEDNDVSTPLGYILSSTQSIPLNASISLPDVKSFKRLVIKKTSSGQLIHLEDIAGVAVGNQSLGGGSSHINGKVGVTFSVSSTPDANPIEVGNAVAKMMHQMQDQLPVGMKTQVLFNVSHILKSSIDEILQTILYAVLLVSLVSLIFLGRPKIALIPIVTIPVCLIGSFVLIWLFGFTINIMTMLALVLATGLVVDDAIVVLENSYRHVQNGLKPVEATHRSLSEISFAVVGMTICLIAVYMPTAFLSGHTAVYFREFAFTLAGAVLISGFVALTLTPMMCSKTLSRANHSRLEDLVDKIFVKLQSLYARTLKRCLQAKRAFMVVFVLLVIGGVFLFKALPSTLMPPFDMGLIFMKTTTDQGTSVDSTLKQSEPLFKEVRELPAVRILWNWVGGVGNSTNHAQALINLKPHNLRSQTSQQVVDKIEALGKNQPGSSVFAVVVDPFGQDQSSNDASGDVSFSINGIVSYEQLNTIAKHFVKELKANKLVRNADSALKLNTQQYNLIINRSLAAELGVPIGTITNALGAYVGGAQLGGIDFIANNHSYPIILQLPKSSLSDFSFLKSIFVKSGSGAELPIAQFVSFKATSTLFQRFHENQLRAAPMGVSLKDGVTIGQGVNIVRQVAAKTLPAGITLEFKGKARKVMESNQSLAWIFILGIVFIYLVLAALFESFIDPFVVLLTVPLCIIGALLVLKFLPHGSLNVYTGVGLVTLIGLVSKHGILITNFANQLQEKGYSLTEAITKSAEIRLRPILMTTATMILGAVPLVLSSGAGSTARMQIGMVIIAGLAIGTVFSLLIVPVAYAILSRKKSKIDNQ